MLKTWWWCACRDVWSTWDRAWCIVKRYYYKLKIYIVNIRNYRYFIYIYIKKRKSRFEQIIYKFENRQKWVALLWYKKFEKLWYSILCRNYANAYTYSNTVHGISCDSPARFSFQKTNLFAIFFLLLSPTGIFSTNETESSRIIHKSRVNPIRIRV